MTQTLFARGRLALRGARAAIVLTVLAAPGSAVQGQRLIDYTPNTRPAWTMDKWQPAMVLSHRFELVDGGDELISVPTITVGTAIVGKVAMGLDFTSNSEVNADKLGENETQWWAAFRGPAGARGGLSGLLGYNTAAGSLDGAVTGRVRARFLTLIAEGRAFSDAFGTGSGGVAGAGGVVFQLTPYLALSGDIGRAFRPDTLGTAWSGSLTLAFPGTRHHFSFHATNAGAVTLQGTSRKKAYGPERVRYGFAFVAPLGTASQWSRIFGRGDAGPVAAVEASAPTAAADDSGRVEITIKDLAFSPATIRIKVGQTVEWVNGDPFAHTATADNKSWGSGFINPGGRYSYRFMVVGRFPYHCEPHPQMKGIVIVEN